jgi:hypothetical protein
MSQDIGDTVSPYWVTATVYGVHGAPAVVLLVTAALLFAYLARLE